MSEQHPPTSADGLRFEEEIAALAHRYYEEEGRPEGRAEEHWHRAQQELGHRQHTPPAEPPYAPESGALG